VGVIIGMDPHKRSATIEVVDERAARRQPGPRLQSPVPTRPVHVGQVACGA